MRENCRVDQFSNRFVYKRFQSFHILRQFPCLKLRRKSGRAANPNFTKSLRQQLLIYERQLIWSERSLIEDDDVVRESAHFGKYTLH